MVHSRHFPRGLEVSPSRSFLEFEKKEIEQSISDRFERQADRYSGQLAIKTKDEAISYGELNRMADRVAKAILSRRGIREEPVALVAVNDLLAIAGMLGVLKAGKIYVPLDPALPMSRIKSLLKDSEAEIIVTCSESFSLAKQLAEDKLQLGSLSEWISGGSDENIGLTVRPEGLAWILYTSSSTGQPKGVLQTHRDELHNIMNMTNSQRLSKDDRMTLLRRPNVAGAIRNVLSALLNGASLFLWDIKKEGLSGLAAWLIREEVTIYHSASTVFRNFVQTLSGNEVFSQLRLVRLGSEPVTWKDVELYKKHFPSECVLVNALSSTEGRTFLQYFVNKETQLMGPAAPVGYPVEGLDIFLLNEKKLRVRRGEIGEIVIRSRYLFPGYWKRSASTREVLMADPQGGDRRLFYTGDLGCMLADGAYEYHGRKDFQFKVRGHRVQIDEVERVLKAVPEVHQAVVVAQDWHNDKRLVAYAVPKRGQALKSSYLRRFLETKLPEFMIPSFFVFLDSLPLSPSGKVDRQALPRAPKSRPELDNSFVAPRTAPEAAVARLWCETLDIESVGIHDDFFELGGHSLLAVQLISRVRDAFQIELPLGALFRAPTVVGLAEQIEIAQRGVDGPKAPPMLRVPRRGNFPLSFAQRQLWLLDQLLPGTPLFNICDARRFKGPLNAAILRESLRALVQRHEALRTRFAEVDKQPAQIIDQAMSLEMPLVNLCKLPVALREAQAKRLAREERNLPFDLANGPLVRAKLFRLETDEHLLLVTMHHIIADQWSMQLFRRELAVLYGAISRGLAPSLPDLAIQFVDFVSWEQNAIKTEYMKAQLAYWETQLAGSLPRLVFKREGGRHKRMSFKTSSLPMELDEGLYGAVKVFGGKEGSTPFMVLLAALNITLHLYTAERDIRIGTLVANRAGSGTERIIGHLINTVILRQRLSRRLTLREILAQTRETTLAAHAHQNLPFEALVRVLEKRRRIQRASLFQVMFIYHNLIFQGADPPGLVFNSQDPWRGADPGVTLTTCDLIFFLKETTAGLAGSVTFKTEIFDPATVSAIRETFVSVLECIISNPENVVAGLSFGDGMKRKKDHRD